MVDLPACLLKPKERIVRSEIAVLENNLRVSDPAKEYKEAFDAGWLTLADFPGGVIPQGTRCRVEDYIECKFADTKADITIECGPDCNVADVHYVCEVRTRRIWLHPAHEITLYSAKAADESFDVVKSVLLCAGGASVVPGVKPFAGLTANKAVYDPAKDTMAGSDCGPCNCFPLAALAVPWAPPREIAVQTGLDHLTTNHDKIAQKTIRESYWSALPPRRRSSPCVEIVTYVLMDRVLVIDAVTKAVISSTETEATPRRTRDLEFSIPGCRPPISDAPPDTPMASGDPG